MPGDPSVIPPLLLGLRQLRTRPASNFATQSSTMSMMPTDAGAAGTRSDDCRGPVWGQPAYVGGNSQPHPGARLFLAASPETGHTLFGFSRPFVRSRSRQAIRAIDAITGPHDRPSGSSSSCCRCFLLNCRINPARASGAARPLREWDLISS